MAYKKKSDIYIFLDTNVFEQCKLFTEIDWSEAILQFKPSTEYKSIILKVPYMVIMELDDHKKYDKEARKALAKIRKFEEDTTKREFDLEISIRPPRWDDLDSKLKEELMENENDHRILAEILIFKKQEQPQTVLFITGDYVPYKLAMELGIETIYWLDKEVKSLFLPPKEEKKPELQVFFIKDENLRSAINWEYNPPQEKSIEDYSDLYEDLKWQDPEKFKGLKPDYELESEVEEYNQKMKIFARFFELDFVLINNGNKPYTNITIEISTILEKEFQIKYKDDIEIPEEPVPFIEFNSLLSPFIPKTSLIHEPNEKYIPIQKQEGKNNNDWYFGFQIEKIRHNESILIPYPIMIWIPDQLKSKKVIFNIQFTQDEPGKIKDQKLEINLLMTKNI